MRRLVPALTVLALLLTTLAGCGHGWALRPPGGPEIVSPAPVGHVVSYGLQGLCVEGPTPATVKSVRFRTAEHLAVQRYAVRTIDWSRQEALGASDRSIVAEGFATSSRRVTMRCDRREDATTELGIDVIATAPVARGQTLEIVYQLENRRLTTEADMDLVVCSYSPERCPTS